MKQMIEAASFAALVTAAALGLPGEAQAQAYTWSTLTVGPDRGAYTCMAVEANGDPAIPYQDTHGGLKSAVGSPPVFGYLPTWRHTHDGYDELEGRNLTHVLEAFAYIETSATSYLDISKLHPADFVGGAVSNSMIPLVSITSDLGYMCKNAFDDDFDTFVNDGCPSYDQAASEDGCGANTCSNGKDDGTGCGGTGMDGADYADSDCQQIGDAESGAAQCADAESGTSECGDGVALNTTDDDTIPDGAINDGCPAVGTREDAGAGECGTDIVDDDGDTYVNDGCPAVGLDDDGDTYVNDGCPAVGDAEPWREQPFRMVLPDAGRRGELVSAIVNLVDSGGYMGADIDIEGWDIDGKVSHPDDNPQDFRDFAEELRQALDTLSPQPLLTVAVQGYVLESQGDFYSLGELSESIDYVSLMGYAYNWDQGCNCFVDYMPVGPWYVPALGLSVRRHLERIVTTGYPAQKVIYLLPFYLPWRQGAKAWNELPADQRQVAKNGCMGSNLLEKQVTLTLDGVTRAVYVTDPASVRAKVQRALFGDEIRLPNGMSGNIGGVGAWQIGQDWLPQATPPAELRTALWEAAQGPTEVEEPCDDNARGTIGSAGGSVTTTSGNGVVIPPRALGEEVEITVAEFRPSVVPPPPDGQAILGLSVEFGPDGQDFSLPVSIILSYTDDDLDGTDPTTLAVWEFDVSTGLWQLLGGIVDNVAQTLTLDVGHFSLYAIMGPAPDTDGDSIPNSTDNCPLVANPNQEDRHVPSNGVGDHCDDPDGDSFTDHIELYLPTDPDDACPDVPGTPGQCPGPSCDGDDAWPFDNNVDTWSNVLDMLQYKGHVQTQVGDPEYDPRLDLNADAWVNVLDVLLYKPFANTSCTNP